jgi:transcriptional regulator with XRE-family HTH domain
MEQMIGNDQRLLAMIDEELLNAEVASLIYQARTRAGITQARLAKLVGTTQPTIARLEDAAYAGHSLTMLRRIATALRMRLEVRFVPEKKSTRAA